MRDSDVNRP